MKRLIAILTTLGILVCTTGISLAVDEAEGRVQSRLGNPSPTAAVSNVDNYTFQDEQVNLGPDDEDVLVLRANQKVLLNRYVTKVFPLQNVTPREIRNIFRELTGKEGGRAEIIKDAVKKENYLQVIVPEWQLPFIEQAVSLIDESWIMENQDGSVAAYYKAKHRSIASVDRIARRWGGEGFTAVDGANNAAIRRDEPFWLGEYLKGAKLVDVPEHQGRFRVKVYEVNVSDDLRLGLDYIAWKNGPGRNLFEFAFIGYDASEQFLNVSGFLNPFQQRTVNLTNKSIHRKITNANASRFGYINFVANAAYLDFLASKGKAKTLAEGVVQVRSGSTATFGATEQVVTFNALPNDPGDTGTEPTRISVVAASEGVVAQTGDLALWDRTVRRQLTGHVGVFIKIAPVILLESMELDVFAYVSSVAGYTPQGLPIINSSRARTKARMADGSVLLLAGLTRQEKVESKQGMPVLSSLPGLGYLFGGENNINRKTQIVIVIECESETGGESRLANAPEIQTIAEQVEGEAIPEIPKNCFGFDMWLLGPKSGAQL